MWIVDPDEVRLRNLTAAKERNRETRALGSRLARTPALRVLVVSLHPRHDDSTLWWFDQGLLAVLAAARADVRYVTDARYHLDERRFAEVGGKSPRRLPWGTDEAQRALAEPTDLVLAITPSRAAIEAAAAHGAPLAVFAVKAHEGVEAADIPPPPPGAKLFHGFLRSRMAEHWLVHALAGTRGAYDERAAPFPVPRFYFPPSTKPPTHDALLFGSKQRDLALAMRALARAGVRSAVAVANEEDVPRVRALASEHGVPMQVHGPLAHLMLRDVVASAKVTLNPIAAANESHYSLVVPLAVGRPIVTTRSPSSEPFFAEGGAVTGVAEGDEDAWASAITEAVRDHEALGRRALTQARDRHDMDRFFVSAIEHTLTR